MFTINTNLNNNDFLAEIVFLGFTEKADYYYSVDTGVVFSISIKDYSKRIFERYLRLSTISKLEIISQFITDEQIEELTFENYKEVLDSIYNTSLKAIKKRDSAKGKNKDKEESKREIDLSRIFTIFQKISLSAGVYDVENTLQSGIFKNGSDSILINGATLIEYKKGVGFRNVNTRIINNVITGRKTIFENDIDLMVNQNTPELSKEELSEIIDTLNTFNFSNGENDINLLLGWVAHSYFSGCLNWRTHLSLTGSRGTGKSTLMDFISRLLNNFGILADGSSTEAGIRQKVKRGAKAVILDESEADGKKIARNLEMLRSSSSGSTVLRGSSTQDGLSYELKIAGMIGGITPPIFNAADSSRFIQLTLDKLKNNNKAELLEDNDLQLEYGLKFIKLLIVNYFDILSINKNVRKILSEKGFDGRFCETNGIVLSFSYFLNNFLNPIDLSDFLSKFDFTAMIEMNEEKDEDSLLDFILSQKISFFDPRNNTKDSVSIKKLASMYNEYVEFGKSKERTDMLNNICETFLDNEMSITKSLSTGDIYIYIDTKKEGFTQLLKEKQKLDVKKVLLRSKNVSDIVTDSSDGRIRFEGSRLKRNAKNVICVNFSAIYLNEF